MMKERCGRYPFFPVVYSTGVGGWGREGVGRVAGREGVARKGAATRGGVIKKL